MRQAPELVGAGAIALAADLLPFDDVEEPCLDDHALAVPLDGSLDQGLGADRRPIVEVDRVGRDPRALRVLEVGVFIDDLEEPRELEVLDDDVGEGAPSCSAPLPALSGETAIGKLVAPGPMIVPRTCAPTARAPSTSASAMLTTTPMRKPCPLP
jgi:hypothetical protein